MKKTLDGKIVIVPDSYKGTLSSEDVAQAIESGVRRGLPEAQILSFPMADGGEGSSSLVGSLYGAHRIDCTVIGPQGRPVEGFYYLASDGKAFIELAAASGLPMVPDPAENPDRRTTHGTGELIVDALTRGSREVFLFLGGSATTDGGIGIARALGWEFYDESGARQLSARECYEAGKPFPGEQPERIHRVAAPGKSALSGVSVTVVCDVKNPLCGPQGASAIYGPQKGLTPVLVEEVDEALRKFSAIVKQETGRDFAEASGAGAAGGAGYGALCFLDANLVDGAEFFVDLIGFDHLLHDCALVITGEGKCDQQSLQGKLLAEILKRTAPAQVPVLSCSGVHALTVRDMVEFPRLKVLGLGHVEQMSDPAATLELLAFQATSMLFGESADHSIP